MPRAIIFRPDGASVSASALKRICVYLRPSVVELRPWHLPFATEFGAKFLARTKAEEGFSHRTDVVTAFDLIELREGRLSAPKKTPLGELEQVQALADRSNRGGEP